MFYTHKSMEKIELYLSKHQEREKALVDYYLRLPNQAPDTAYTWKASADQRGTLYAHLKDTRQQAQSDDPGGHPDRLMLHVARFDLLTLQQAAWNNKGADGNLKSVAEIYQSSFCWPTVGNPNRYRWRMHVSRKNPMGLWTVPFGWEYYPSPQEFRENKEDQILLFNSYWIPNSQQAGYPPGSMWNYRQAIQPNTVPLSTIAFTSLLHTNHHTEIAPKIIQAVLEQTPLFRENGEALDLTQVLDGQTESKSFMCSHSMSGTYRNGAGCRYADLESDEFIGISINIMDLNTIAGPISDDQIGPMLQYNDTLTKYPADKQLDGEGNHMSVLDDEGNPRVGVLCGPAAEALGAIPQFPALAFEEKRVKTMKEMFEMPELQAWLTEGGENYVLPPNQPFDASNKCNA